MTEYQKKQLEQQLWNVANQLRGKMHADFLPAIDAKIDAVAEQIDKMKQFKKGLLQQMFV